MVLRYLDDSGGASSLSRRANVAKRRRNILLAGLAFVVGTLVLASFIQRARMTVFGTPGSAVGGGLIGVRSPVSSTNIPSSSDRAGDIQHQNPPALVADSRSKAETPTRTAAGTPPSTTSTSPAASPTGSPSLSPAASAQRPAPRGVSPALAPFVYRPSASFNASALSCATPPFSSIAIVIVLTHCLARPPDSRNYCASLWKYTARAGVQFILLGDDTIVPKNRKYDHIMKLQLVAAFFDEVDAKHLLPDDTLVVLHDAVDVYMAGSIDELFSCLSARWCEKGYDPVSDVMFLGERGFWPPSDAYSIETYPVVAEDYRFINTGVYAGPWRATSAMLKESISNATNAKTCACDDQESANSLFTNNAAWRKRIHLDSDQQCFGSAHQSRQDYAYRDGRWTNTKTGHSPLLLHFNGEWGGGVGFNFCSAELLRLFS